MRHADKASHEATDLICDRATLDIAYYMNNTKPYESVEVLVRAEARKKTVGLMEVHYPYKLLCENL